MTLYCTCYELFGDYLSLSVKLQQSGVVHFAILYRISFIYLYDPAFLK
jgi:hypothetical protein